MPLFNVGLLAGTKGKRTDSIPPLPSIPAAESFQTVKAIKERVNDLNQKMDAIRHELDDLGDQIDQIGVDEADLAARLLDGETNIEKVDRDRLIGKAGELQRQLRIYEDAVRAAPARISAEASRLADQALQPVFRWHKALVADLAETLVLLTKVSRAEVDAKDAISHAGYSEGELIRRTPHFLRHDSDALQLWLDSLIHDGVLSGLESWLPSQRTEATLEERAMGIRR